jgi:RNA polymerase sigma-70 factor (ECF subfamily)
MEDEMKMPRRERARGAAAPGDEDFIRLTEPFRRELVAHCYRLLGSVFDAEDAVQETYLNAWRAFEDFEGRSSVRTWLYRIATRVCLRALERANRRPMPSGLGGPSESPEKPSAAALPDAPWLQPIPNALFSGGPDDPAATVESRQSMRLAFIAALQYLPPRQRAVLILRDVLAWRSAEVAELLEATTASVNSALQRARTQLARIAPAEGDIAEPTDAGMRALLDAYMVAFENADIATLTRLLTRDAVFEMPPFPTWFAGRDHVLRFLADRNPRPGLYRAVPTMANNQLALALYLAGPDATYRAHALQMLTVTAGGISHIANFHAAPDLFPMFGLPMLIESVGGSERRAPRSTGEWRMAEAHRGPGPAGECMPPA